MKIYILLLWIHFIADFIFQTDQMALNKSKSNAWLLFHVSVYSLFFIPFGLLFAGFNMVCHLITDWISSRLTSYYWKKQQRHLFFVIIGLDQAIHMTTLFLSYEWIIK